MRIGIQANPLLAHGWGGIEVYLAELVTRMPRLGRAHDFRLYFNYCRSRNRRSVERFVQPGVTLRVCRIPWQIVQPMQRHFGLPVDWLAGRMDVMFYPSFVALPQRRGRKVVVVHDVIPLTHPHFCEPEQRRAFASQVPPSVARADAVIAVSAYTKEVVEERLGIDADRIYCVPNGVHEVFQPATDSGVAAAVARRYGIEGPYLLFVGTLEPRKNLVRLVDAFARAGRAVSDHTLVLAGKPAWGRAELLGAIRRVPAPARVLAPGYVAVADLPDLYRGATAFVFPSAVEGFGIPVLEAMASGCPVLTSDTPALSEVVGEAALAVDPLDTNSIADGIRRLVEDSDLREALRARGLRRAKEFSWDRTADETLTVLERIGRP